MRQFSYYMTRSFRFVFALLLYSLIAALSYWGAWLLRFGFVPDLSGIPEHFQPQWWQQALYLLPFKLFCLYAFGQFNGFIRFFRFPDALRLAGASGLFSSICLVFWYFTSFRFVPPALVLAADFLLFTFLTFSLRVGIRLLDEWWQGLNGRGAKVARVAVIGVGEVGSALVSELLSQRSLGMRPVALFDDRDRSHGRSLHGIPVLGKPEDIPVYYEAHKLDKVILAMPSATPDRVRAISMLLKAAKIPLETVPTLGQLLRGARATELREVQIEDLLYREPVAINSGQIASLVQGKCVWVTGAGGSIGSELALQVARLAPRRLVLIDRSEGALFQTEKQLLDEELNLAIKVEVADLRDSGWVERFMENDEPQIIFHAAAHKHVGMMERQPGEAFTNNTCVTLELARQAVRYGVEAFCLISTDKAVDPSSVMGATKRLAERALQCLIDAGAAGGTAFTIVRFGNVIGSSGSVIPIFEKQIAARRPITVTDKEATRYFMTIAEAVGLVLQATAFRAKAALFTLDMGEPVKIDEMARDLIRLKGLEPDVDIPIHYIGLRTGEKLHESIHYNAEEMEATSHPKIGRVSLRHESEAAAQAYLQALDGLANKATAVPGEAFREHLFALL